MVDSDRWSTRSLVDGRLGAWPARSSKMTQITALTGENSCAAKVKLIIIWYVQEA